MQIFRRIILLATALAVTSGCYSTKMMEFTYLQLDTLKTTQAELLRKIEAVSLELELEREARLSGQAGTSAALSDLQESVNILSNRFEDYMQLLASLNPSVKLPPRLERGPESGGVNVTPLPAPSQDAADTSGVTRPVRGDGEAEKLFKASYMDLTTGNYDLAVQGFKNYLVRYPEAANLPDAHYYLAESYYSSGRFLEAVAEFQLVIKEFPRSRLVPASYLKSGICYRELDEKQLADRAFRELIARFPHTEEAEQARVALKEMGG